MFEQDYLQQILAETYGSKTAVKPPTEESSVNETDKIDLEKIDAETQALTEVLDLINRERYSQDEFPVILKQINLAIENFGLEKFKANFLAVNNLILSGKIDFKDLSPNLQNFMYSGYHCLQRLNEHLPEIWKTRKQEIDSGWDGQIVEKHGPVLIEVYLEAISKLGNPQIPREIMLKVFSKFIMPYNQKYA